MSEIKVFKMNDMDYMATPWDKEKTLEFYKIEYGCDIELDDMEEQDIENDGMFNEISIEEAHALLNKLASGEKVNGKKTLEFNHHAGDLFVWVTFKTELDGYKEITEPFVICSTEY